MPEASPVAHELSFLALFLQADPIVKGVMIILVLSSLACWTVAIDRFVRIKLLQRRARQLARAAEGRFEGLRTEASGLNLRASVLARSAFGVRR